MTTSSVFSTTPFLNHHQNCLSLTNFTCSCASHFKNPKKKLPKSSKIKATTTVEDPSLTSSSPNGSSPTASLFTDEENEAMAKVGSRVRVKVPLKVYHIPKVAEFDLNNLEGEIKQFVGIWKGKRISANFPFKVQFVVENIEGRDGPVKFFAHLKEDEFGYLD